MKQWIRKVAATPLENVAKVINSLVSGDDKTTNAPSIKAVNDALATKQDTLTIDEYATEDSMNPVASGDVFRLGTSFGNLQAAYYGFVATQAVVKNDFAVVTETLTFSGSGTKTFFINYPEGFNYQNSYIIAVNPNAAAAKPIFYDGTSSGIVLQLVFDEDVGQTYNVPVKILLYKRQMIL